MKNQPTRAIDLGALQATFVAAKKQLAADARALAKAQDAHDRARKAFTEATEALKGAARMVLE